MSNDICYLFFICVEVTLLIPLITEQFKGKVSFTWFKGIRPKNVIDAERQTSLCPYHLRFQYMAEALLRFLTRRHRQHASGLGGLSKQPCQCGLTVPSSPQKLRAQLTCGQVQYDKEGTTLMKDFKVLPCDCRTKGDGP